MRRTTKVLAALVVAALAASAVLGGVAADYTAVGWEVREANRNDRINDGQSNNLDGLPLTGPAFILDSVYMTHSTLTTVAGPRYMVNGFAEENTLSGDVLLPGAGQFFAWYGWWFDVNGDGFVDYEATCEAAQCIAEPGNEFGPTEAVNEAGMQGVGPTPDATIVAFVHPGAHPTVDSNSDPKPNQPDFYFTYQAWTESPAEYIDRGYPAVYLDGSLLQKVSVATMANGRLLTDPETDRPFTCPRDGRCLVDVDLYTAVAPGPVADLYDATLADTVNALPAVSAWPVNSLAHDTGSWLPSETREHVGPVMATLTPGHPLEYLDPGSSAYLTTLAAYQEDYHAWVDARGDWLQPGMAAQSYNGFGFGGPDGNEHSAAPGVFAISANTGVWKDINQDGVIGTAGDAENPYADGTKVDPMDYGTSTAEWFGWFPSADCEDRGEPDMLATFTPTGPGGWGAAGVVVMDFFASDPERWRHVTGSDEIVIPVICYNADPNLGSWYGYEVLYFPAGNHEAPFSFELTPLDVHYTNNGFDLQETIWDVDHVAAFNPGA